MPAKQLFKDPDQVRMLEALGERLRLARLRRGLSAEITSQAAGISRMTLFRAESGSAAIAIGTLLRILVVLDLGKDFEAIARDDELGRYLQDEALPRRRRRARAP
jgi:transcriptional regulator with XRE-family HTH domain